MSRLGMPNRHGSAHKKSFSKRTPNNKFGGLLSGSFAPMRHGANSGGLAASLDSSTALVWSASRCRRHARSKAASPPMEAHVA